MSRYVCIHCHFYQPPRENPWLEKVERQESAYPYHDWNERITAECYLPNTKSPILGVDGKEIVVVNNYEKIDFNFGPTLLSWIERRKPEVYQTIIKADKVCQERFSGHGSAIAQIYNHIIMPLANRRDKQTQVVWGIKDFQRRFERHPEGMWLAETAVNTETLETLAENGIKFTILSPRQAKQTRKIGNIEWQNTTNESIDTRMAYLCRLPSGKTINLFFYNGKISHEISFGYLLNNGEDFAKRLISTLSENGAQNQLVSIATDGETFGHHKRYGDMALAYCLYHIETHRLAEITVYGEYLEKYPPEHEVEIVENSSWSCIHGVERWKSNCGCSAGANLRWTQEWREPLRQAMDWVRGRLIDVYENEMSVIINDPWNVRDDYISTILDKSKTILNDFLLKHAGRELSKKDKFKVIKLLEMQKHAMYMYTSCGWFFDDISRIETIQLMQCAARAMQLANEVCGVSLEADYLALLKQAPSNVEAFKTGDKVFEMLVKPTIPENANIKLQERFMDD